MLELNEKSAGERGCQAIFLKYNKRVHHIHTTNGLVINSRPYGEAGKIIQILTSDFGLVSAIATGIRLEKSKLRYKIQDYSFGSFSLVKGKEFWRIVGAEDLDIVESQSKVDGNGLVLIQIANLLRRLIHGEENNPEVFGCLYSCYLFLNKSPELTTEQTKTLESVVVIRILYNLGYIEDIKEYKDFLHNHDLSIELVDSLAKDRVEINRHINKALKESHL